VSRVVARDHGAGGARRRLRQKRRTVPNLPRQRPVSFAARGQNASETDRQQVNAAASRLVRVIPACGIDLLGCHGARNVAHLRADVTSAVMAPVVGNLSDADIRDLAAYYAFLPRVWGQQTGAGAAPRIVASGAPMRGIAPCGACHGELDSKAGAAWLEGQPLVYLRSQLKAFSSGARRNA
jgi:cytochrome c553